MRRVCFQLCVLLALTCAATAHAQSDDATSTEPPTAYNPLIEQATAEFDAGNWAEALALFTRAHEAFANSQTLRGIGMASFELRDYPGAIHALTAALDDTRRPLTDEHRAQVSALRDRASLFVGRFTVASTSSSARLFVDGERERVSPGWPETEGVLILGVGQHEILLRDDDGHATRAQVVVRGGENEPLELDFEALQPTPEPEFASPEPLPPTERPLRPATREREANVVPWVIGAASLAVSLAGVTLLAAGLTDIRSVETAPRGTEWSTLEQANDQAPAYTAVGMTMIVVGGVGLVSSIVWLIAGSGVEENTSDVNVAIGPSSIAVRGRW